MRVDILDCKSDGTEWWGHSYTIKHWMMTVGHNKIKHWTCLLTSHGRIYDNWFVVTE